MPTIEATTSTVLAIGVEGKTSALIQEDIVEPEGSINLSEPPETQSNLLLFDIFIDSVGSTLLSTDIDSTGNLNLIEVFEDHFQNLLLVEESLSKLGILRLVAGNVPPFLADVNSLVTLNTIDIFKVHLQDVPLLLVDRTAESTQALNLEPNEEVGVSGGLTLVDVIGPVIQNEIPLSGSTFNDPSTDITFDLVDAAIGITESSIEFAINGIIVVQNGAPLLVSGFGEAFLTKVSDNLYQFQFIKDDPFDFHETVTISGFAEDQEIPANSGNFLYTFRVWDEAYLGGTIIGGPDIEGPFLINQLPFPGQIQVDPNINITLEIADDHTGVDPNSVIIKVDGNTVVNSGSEVTDFATTTISSVPGIRGFRYEIDPNETLPFFNTTLIEVEACDLFTVSGNPNCINEFYTFTTTSNAHLSISGFSVLVSGQGYVPFDLMTSLPSEDPTNFRIIYTDLTGSGIDITESTVFHNDVEISGITFTEVVSGNIDSYFVDFAVEPFYFGDSELLFRAVQVFSGAVSGTVAPFRETITDLLWGYEICYDPLENLDNSKDIGYCVRVCDRGDFPKLGVDCNTFTTAPRNSKILSASVIGQEESDFTDIIGQYESINTFFEFGKNMVLEIEVKDFNGNTLIFPWTFTIQDKPPEN